MKRLVLLMLAIGILLSASAQAAEGDATFTSKDEMFALTGDYPVGGCVMGDALYLFGERHIYAYRTGEAGLTQWDCELPPAGTNEAREMKGLFADGNELYALWAVYRSAEDGYAPARLEIASVETGSDVRFGEPREADARALTVSYGSDSMEVAQINSLVCADGYLFLDVYADGRKIYALRLDSGEGAYLDIDNVAGICAWPDGGLLVETWDRSAGRVAFLNYDAASGRAGAVCELAQQESAYIGIAYSAESGRMFYLRDGYVMAVENFDFEGAEPVAEIVTRDGDEGAALLMPGDFYVYCAQYDRAVVRSTAPGALPEKRLVVQCAGIFQPMLDAYYSFNASHSDAAVVLKEDWDESGAVIEAMMQRNSSVDIYVQSVNTEAFDALYSRGYMAPIENAEIDAAVAGMYPAIRDALTREGEIVAVPVNVSGWTLGLDYDGFELLGIAREEMPATWSDFLDLLPRLPELLPVDGSVHIFDDYCTQQQVRRELLNRILESWHHHLRATGQAVRYDSPELTATMEKLMALDLGELGLPEDDGESEYVMVSYAGVKDEHILIQTSANCAIGYYSDAEPALLAVVPGEPAQVPVGVVAAFVNPFSENAELAAEYLAELYAHLDVRTLYNLSDALNEPVRGKQSQQNLERIQQEIEAAREAMEAAEEVDKPMWEERIATYEEYIEMIDEYGWDVSPKEIEWYRTHADNLIVKRYSYVNVTEGNNEFSDLVEQLLDGRMRAGDFLNELDRRVTMKAREEM